jgi:hypothetical protein
MKRKRWVLKISASRQGIHLLTILEQYIFKINNKMKRSLEQPTSKNRDIIHGMGRTATKVIFF